MPAESFPCPRSLKACCRHRSCSGCRTQAALQNRDYEELRRTVMVRWTGGPVEASSWKEFMATLGVSEAEAREMAAQEQILVDNEITRFSKSIQ